MIMSFKAQGEGQEIVPMMMLVSKEDEYCGLDYEKMIYCGRREEDELICGGSYTKKSIH
jgi:hypothetical protein